MGLRIPESMVTTIWASLTRMDLGWKRKQHDPSCITQILTEGLLCVRHQLYAVAMLPHVIVGTTPLFSLYRKSHSAERQTDLLTDPQLVSGRVNMKRIQLVNNWVTWQMVSQFILASKLQDPPSPSPLLPPQNWPLLLSGFSDPSLTPLHFYFVALAQAHTGFLLLLLLFIEVKFT